MAYLSRDLWRSPIVRLFAGLFLVLTLAIAADNAPEANSAPAKPAAQERNEPSATLSAFGSDKELIRFLRQSQRRPYPPIPAPPAPAMAMDTAQSAPMVVTAVRAAELITNTQEAGVDEGDIVKARGNFLIILRRGRLFTVSIADGGMRPVDSINAYPPGVDARDDWYDEMLVAGDRVVVIGYSYEREGTQINRFRIDKAGKLRFEDAYQLRSNDYYSSRNYASRLIGHELITYSPFYLSFNERNPLSSLPGLRRWVPGKTGGEFKRFVGAQSIFIPSVLRKSENAAIDALHTVTRCDLTAAILDCEAVGVLGPEGRSFYVSARAVYVWVTNWDWGPSPARNDSESFLYRIPLDGGRPSAVGVRGAPIDQFSFREDDGVLNVLVRSDSKGDSMWNAEFSSGAVALLRIPTHDFGTGSREAPRSRYRMLPSPPADGYSFQNRFAGDYVLYGTGNGWYEPKKHKPVLVVAPVKGGAVTQIPFEHSIDRIEIMGRDAMIVGGDEKNLYFSTVALGSRQRPALGDRYVLSDAAQTETRSHAYFYNPLSANGDSGVLGLPVARPARAVYKQLFESSAAMLFLRRTDRKLAPLGELAAASEGFVDDDCVASCVDWYGNARPIFLRGRIFALLGYELVEGATSETGIRETGRVSFAPVTKPVETRSKAD